MKKMLVLILMVMTLVGNVLPVFASEVAELVDSQENIASGVVDNEDGQITWVIDSEGKLTVTGTGNCKTFHEDGHYGTPWDSYCESILSVEINATGIGDASELFYGCRNMTSVDLSNFDTTNVTNMCRMFDGCSSLRELDLSNFDTTNVTDMYSMFGGCSSLTELDLSNFDTSNVTSMGQMFYSCSSLTELNLSNFDTNNVTDMGSMFYCCSFLSELNISGFATSNVTDMSRMFYNTELKELDLSHFDMKNVVDTEDMLNYSIIKVNVPMNCSVDIELPLKESYYQWSMPDGTVITTLPQGLTESIVIEQKDSRPKCAAPTVELLKENGIVTHAKLTNNATDGLKVTLVAVPEDGDDSKYYQLGGSVYFWSGDDSIMYPFSSWGNDFCELQAGNYVLKAYAAAEDYGYAPSDFVTIDDYSFEVKNETYTGDPFEMIQECGSNKTTFYISVSSLPDGVKNKLRYVKTNEGWGGYSESNKTADGSHWYYTVWWNDVKASNLSYYTTNSDESGMTFNVVTIPEESLEITVRDTLEKNVAVLDYDYYMSFIASGGMVTFDSESGEFEGVTDGFKDQNDKWTLKSFIDCIAGANIYDYVKNLGKYVFEAANAYWKSEVGAFVSNGLYDTEGNEISKESISEHDIVLVKYEPEIVWVDSMKLTAPATMPQNETATVTVTLDAGQDKYPFNRTPQIRYESSNPEIVFVDSETGELTAGTTPGTATITAYADEDLRLAEGLDEIVTASVEITVGTDAVSNLKAISAGKCKVKLTWSAVDGAEGYLVYAQKDGKYGYAGMTTKGTTFTDTKALDTDYNFYWVFPYVKDSMGKMFPSGCPKYVFAKGICPAVTNLKAASVKGGVKLTWSAVDGAEGYLVYGIENGGKYGYVGMTTRGTTFTATKASKTAYNYYWVFPYHKDANGKMIVGGTAKYTYGRAL